MRVNGFPMMVAGRKNVLDLYILSRFSTMARIFRNILDSDYVIMYNAGMIERIVSAAAGCVPVCFVVDVIWGDHL